MTLRRTLVTWLTLIDVAAAAVAMVTMVDRYGIIADAGSSSTKVKVFKWQDSDDGELPSLQLLGTEKVKPGLGNFVRDHQGLMDHLSHVIKMAANIVPASAHAATPIFVMSTAGTRVLQPFVAQDFTQSIERCLSNSSFNPFLFRPNHAQILSGEEEGVYGWIALNYLRGYFRKNRSEPESAGILEMGGGSTQVAFVPEVPLYSEEFHVQLLGSRYSLYVHSHLQFGLTFLRNRIHNLLVLNSSSSGVVYNPCFLKGDVTQIQVGDGVRQMEGTGEPGQCRGWLRRLVYRAGEADCLTQPCGLGAVYQPPLGNRTFYATQAFQHGPSTVKALRPDHSLDLQKLVDNADVYCSKTLAEAEAEYGINKKFASNECFDALYIAILLQTYGFTQDSRVYVTSEVGNVSIDWALGALLYEISSRDTISYCPAPAAATGAASPSSPCLPLLCLLVVTMTTTLGQVLRQ